MSPLRLEPLMEEFAARATGLDLSRPLPAADRDALLDAWARYPVLCLPGQVLDPDALEAFTLQVGPFGEDPFVEPMEGHPNVLEVLREPDEKGIVFGAAWHSDWSFQETPPSATILQARIIPPVGGDTLYADMRRAFDELPAELKERVLGLRAVHSAALPYGSAGAFAKDESPRAMKIVSSEAAHARRTHPMVRTHPTSGRRALFVNPTYTCGVEGLPQEEGGELLFHLYAHCFEDRFVYRHRWEPDMLVMWDNRCTVHNACGGYEGHRRLLYRTTVAGERPYLAA